MFGVYVALDCNTKDQVKVLLKKSRAWAQKVKHSHLGPYEAFVAYHFVLLQALLYLIVQYPNLCSG